ncbi:MAG: hypothetical protein H7Y59_09865 [Anaerolineales bacterium]|nr:hypothetical protein [Anaerolineales bacterium]
MIRIEKQISALELFNEKASKLTNSAFIKSLTDKDKGIKIGYNTIGENKFSPIVMQKGHSNDELDAFILTYRFFIQNNEASSFNNIAEIYNDPNLHKMYKTCFQAARTELTNLLNSLNKFGIEIDNRKLSNIEILDTYIYGELAHANSAKREKFQSWIKDEVVASLLTASLCFCLIEILNIIYYVQILNDGVIKHLHKEISL